MDGLIKVRNVGKAPAGPSKLTLGCVRLAAPIQVNSCPDLPPSLAAKYFDRMFPKNATIQIPPLASGQTFTHTLLFWRTFVWPLGKYKFTATADAGRALSKHTTKDNVATSILAVP